MLKEAFTEHWGPMFTGVAAKTSVPGWANLNCDPGCIACNMRHVCQEGA